MFRIVVWLTVRGLLSEPTHRVKSVIISLILPAVRATEAYFCHTAHMKIGISIVFRCISQRTERNKEFIRLKHEASQVINSNNNIIRL